MNQTQATKTAITRAQALSESLVYAALGDRSFAETLKDRVGSGSTGHIELILNERSQLLLPDSQVSAGARLEWLMGRVSGALIEGSREASTILSGYVSQGLTEVPRMLVVGFAAIAIPGITLGLFDNKKKIALVLRADIASKVDLRLSRRVSQLCSEIIKTSLEQAGGDVKALDPDTADWLFGDREMDFFQTDSLVLRAIEDDMKELGMPAAVYEDKRGLAMLALSPVVNRLIAERYYRLDKIEI